MTHDTQRQVLRVILHAPTPDALERARNNALNLRRADPDAELCIIVNAAAVSAALDIPHPEADALTWVCPNTLARINRDNRRPLQILDAPAVLKMAQWQRDGWVYIRS